MPPNQGVERNHPDLGGICRLLGSASTPARKTGRRRAARPSTSEGRPYGPARWARVHQVRLEASRRRNKHCHDDGEHGRAGETGRSRASQSARTGRPSGSGRHGPAGEGGPDSIGLSVTSACRASRCAQSGPGRRGPRRRRRAAAAASHDVRLDQKGSGVGLVADRAGAHLLKNRMPAARSVRRLALEQPPRPAHPARHSTMPRTPRGNRPTGHRNSGRRPVRWQSEVEPAAPERRPAAPPRQAGQRDLGQYRGAGRGRRGCSRASTAVGRRRRPARYGTARERGGPTGRPAPRVSSRQAARRAELVAERLLRYDRLLEPVKGQVAADHRQPRRAGHPVQRVPRRQRRGCPRSNTEGASARSWRRVGEPHDVVVGSRRRSRELGGHQVAAGA